MEDAMLNVKSVSEVTSLIQARFGTLRMGTEPVDLGQALGRVAAQPVRSNEYVPDFNRSTVDGYAVMAADVFGCSESIPALLTLVGEVGMGTHTELELHKGECVYVHTGSEVPRNADAVVMLEYAENFGDGTIAINKPAAPGANLIFRGDDVKPGTQVIPAGRRLNAADIGSLAALGIIRVNVKRSPQVAVFSTGDELVSAGESLTRGRIRDVNAPMLSAAVVEAGGTARFYGILVDDANLIQEAVAAAIPDCDLLLISGSTSVGVRDAVPEVISRLGELLVHGVAAKPGKPTIVGIIQGKPVFGLPGNPLAAYFMFYLFVRPLLYQLLGTPLKDETIPAVLSRAVSSNQGREEFIPVTLQDGTAIPISAKSGLITSLSAADGFIRILRDCEGLPQGTPVEVIKFKGERCPFNI
jgi:molybdopterin molybdotransferase